MSDTKLQMYRQNNINTRAVIQIRELVVREKLQVRSSQTFINTEQAVRCFLPNFSTGTEQTVRCFLPHFSIRFTSKEMFTTRIEATVKTSELEEWQIYLLMINIFSGGQYWIGTERFVGGEHWPVGLTNALCRALWISLSYPIQASHH